MEQLRANPISNPSPSQRGQSFEYALSAELLKHGCALNNDEWSAAKMDRQGKIFSSLSDDQKNSIARLASSCVDSLEKVVPLDNTIVTLVRGESRRNQVHDLSVTNPHDNTVTYISAKTNETVEDKAYRFSDATYVFHSALNATQFFMDLADTGVSIEDAIESKGSTVDDVHCAVAAALFQSLKSGGEGYDTMLSYIKDRAIGSGGYYKTTKNGGVDYYEIVHSVNSIDNISLREKTVSFDAHVTTDTGDMVYAMDFRVKFKDGKSKPLMTAKNGAMTNLAATVRIVSRHKVEYDA